jgi:hypothetical protein
MQSLDVKTTLKPVEGKKIVNIYNNSIFYWSDKHDSFIPELQYEEMNKK